MPASEDDADIMTSGWQARRKGRIIFRRDLGVVVVDVERWRGVGVLPASRGEDVVVEVEGNERKGGDLPWLLLFATVEYEVVAFPAAIPPWRSRRATFREGTMQLGSRMVVGGRRVVIGRRMGRDCRTVVARNCRIGMGMMEVGEGAVEVPMISRAKERVIWPLPYHIQRHVDHGVTAIEESTVS